LLRAPRLGPPDRVALLPADSPPLLTVVIDTEEEFDWAKPLARANQCVTSIAAQGRAQEIYARHGLVPTYVIDYAVVNDEDAVRHLRTFADDGACEIGAHLHPWVNPPDQEAVTPFNSYPGNLPAALEGEKLGLLTEAIERRFGQRPTVYKAGRYGIGPNTGRHLEALGYTVDASVVPHTNFDADGGPDFTTFGPEPYWFGATRRLLELPLSVGFAGLFGRRGTTLYPKLFDGVAAQIRAPGIFARSRLLERIRLSPEGIDSAAHRRLARSLIAQGHRVLTMTYHSPSLAPGHTPYVRNAAELDRFLKSIDGFLSFFREQLGGRFTTPTALYRQLSTGQ
jgi:hypothetical protein